MNALTYQLFKLGMVNDRKIDRGESTSTKQNRLSNLSFETQSVSEKVLTHEFENNSQIQHTLALT